MGSADTRFSKGKDDQSDRDGSFGFKEGYTNKIGTNIGTIGSVYEDASMVYGMRNNQSGARNAGSACVAKMVGQYKRTGEKGSGFNDNNPTSGEYEFGDMVWGKVKSHPWWPGQVYDEALAVSSVHETKIAGQVLVAFFGDDSYGWFDPAELLPFDAYYAEKSKQTKARSFIDAVDHADNEVSKRAALGMACHCTSIFRSVKGFLTVDVCGYEPGGLYNIRKIRSARAGFQSVGMLNFVKHLALMPCAKLQRTVHWVRNVAIVAAYRRAVFQEHDRTYIEAFAAQPPFSENFRIVFTLPNKGTSQVQSASSLAINKVSSGSTTVKDRIEKYNEFCEPEDDFDATNVHDHTLGQQSFSVPQEKASTGVSKLILGRTDLCKKTEFSCQEMMEVNSFAIGKKPKLHKHSRQELTVEKAVMVNKIKLRTDGLHSAAKPPKKRIKPGDYANVRWVGNFYGAEEKSSGVLKKTNDWRSSRVKFSDGKCLKSQGDDHKETLVSSPMRQIKNSQKEEESPERVAKAAGLVMEFPRLSTLPTILELKEKFARFGPFDRIHLFWKSSTCQIVFKNEFDAQVACRYAVKNRSMFGNVNVQYKVQALPAPGQELPNSGKKTEQDASDEDPKTQLSFATSKLKTKAPQKMQLARMHPEIPMSKPQDNKLQFTFGCPDINPNVKCTLIGDRSDKADKSSVNGIIQKPRSSYANLISSSSPPVIPGYNARNFIKHALPLSYSYSILDSHKSKKVYQCAEACNRQYLQDRKRNNHVYETNQDADISSAMLSLLNQCSSILADLKSSIGYVPYHL